MSVVEIKSELQRLIEQETDLKLLEAIRAMLQEVNLNPILKKKLTEHALQAEEDILAGRVFTKEQLIELTTRK